jgi:hypothetical protein
LDDVWPFSRKFAIEFKPSLGTLIGVSKDCVRRTFRFADAAINAFVRMNDEHVLAFVKAINGADFNTVRIFALDAGFRYHVSHLRPLICVQNALAKTRRSIFRLSICKDLFDVDIRCLAINFSMSLMPFDGFRLSGIRSINCSL